MQRFFSYVAKARQRLIIVGWLKPTAINNQQSLLRKRNVDRNQHQLAKANSDKYSAITIKENGHGLFFIVGWLKPTAINIQHLLLRKRDMDSTQHFAVSLLLLVYCSQLLAVSLLLSALAD